MIFWRRLVSNTIRNGALESEVMSKRIPVALFSVAHISLIEFRAERVLAVQTLGLSHLLLNPTLVSPCPARTQ
jgi:hypothetical protein